MLALRKPCTNYRIDNKRCRIFKMKKMLLSFAFLMGIAIHGFAEETAEAELQELPEPPELPAQMQSGETIEPEVTIIRREDATIEEYRINGRRYMVKVTPVVGKPYYLVDKDGNGSLETRMSDIYNDIAVPQWVLFSW